MAQSDYAHLKIATNAKPTEKTFKGFCGTKVEIYKNSVYLVNKEFPVIEIHRTADIHMGDLHVQTAESRHQQGLLVYATNRQYETKIKDGKEIHKNSRQRFAAIACSGYQNMNEEVYKQFYSAFPEYQLEDKFQNPVFKREAIFCYSSCGDEKNAMFIFPKILQDKFGMPNTLEIPMPEAYNTPWIGVSKEMVDELYHFIALNLESGDEKWFDKIQWADLTYTNPGDQFFHKHLGVETPVQKVGEATQPIAMQILENME